MDQNNLLESIKFNNKSRPKQKKVKIKNRRPLIV